MASEGTDGVLWALADNTPEGKAFLLYDTREDDLENVALGRGEGALVWQYETLRIYDIPRGEKLFLDNEK